MEHIKIAREHKDKIKIKVTDGYYINFGRSYYHIDFEILNKDGSECYEIITRNNGRISWYIHHEGYYMIDNVNVLDEINKNIQKDYEWVTTILEYHTFHNGYITFNWRPTLIDKKDTRIKLDPEEKTFNFTRKDDILEEYNDVVKMIQVEERALISLKDKQFGIAKEYYNRKNDFNIGDIVHMERYGGELEFGVVDSVDVYRLHEKPNHKEDNQIEDDYWISVHTTPIIKSGKAKKSNWGFSKIIGVICKEKEFTKIAFSNDVKGILNKDNLTKLYNKLKTNLQHEHQ